MFKGKKIYIECGANDGIKQSRSLELSKDENYIGILIEPHPVTFSECVKNRNNGRTLFFNCALVSSSYKEKFVTIYEHKSHSLMNCLKDSTMLNSAPHQYKKSSIVVPAFTITDILSSLGITFVDNFYLDTEGYEIPILNGVSDSIKINELETEQHNLSAHSSERKGLIEICSKINMKLVDVIENDGFPKLIFKHKDFLNDS